ncbi:thioredoxin-disulfide reductase [Silvanigrella paludirubra]|uniref:Thioredoxin reductase n=1 Tax=Silvanigrella paludirubra TaxID=2499159 RepID=A0A6N6VTH4_9BACT|nr:thioredoxin-disulfide reductase [Silvanigrella paludirubra]KAB8037095.1 thioredoxin-disulfide reductase [Silvanigrella paludirubra]
MEKVVIIGSGPSGLTSAIYTARAALSPVVISGMQPGGQLTTTSIIENWPGFVDGIDGNKLMNDMREQAEKVGARMLTGSVTKVEVTNKGTFLIKRDYEEDIEAKVVIVATGASAITLPLPSKDKLMGYGLSTCAVCDGFFYRNKKVAVVGGGDSAMEEAMYLSKLASEVILIHRSDKFRASKAMQERVIANPKIKIIYSTDVIDTLANDKGLTGIVTKDKSGKTNEIMVDGLFMAIGHHPNTDFVKGLVNMDEKGYILTQNGTHTNIPGLFAAGDVEDKLYRQAITAAGRGCQAALQAEKFIEGMEH